MHTPHPTHPPRSAPSPKPQKPSKESGVFQSRGPICSFLLKGKVKRGGAMANTKLNTLLGQCHWSMTKLKQWWRAYRPNVCLHTYSVARERFLDRGGLKIVRSCQRLGGEAPQTPLFSNARFYEQDTQQTYFDRHQLHARSSDRNFFRIIFYRGKQDCLLPLGFSNHARITTHVFVKCKIPQ